MGGRGPGLRGAQQAREGGGAKVKLLGRRKGDINSRPTPSDPDTARTTDAGQSTFATCTLDDRSCTFHPSSFFANMSRSSCRPAYRSGIYMRSACNEFFQPFSILLRSSISNSDQGREPSRPKSPPRRSLLKTLGPTAWQTRPLSTLPPGGQHGTPAISVHQSRRTGSLLVRGMPRLCDLAKGGADRDPSFCPMRKGTPSAGSKRKGRKVDVHSASNGDKGVWLGIMTSRCAFVRNPKTSNQMS